MPARDPEPGLTAEEFDAALARAGIVASADERARALEAARRLRTEVACLDAWNARNDPEPT